MDIMPGMNVNKSQMEMNVNIKHIGKSIQLENWKNDELKEILNINPFRKNN